MDAWQLDSWEAYRDVARRLGRKTRLPEKQRAVLWSIFDQVRRRLKSGNLVTDAGMFSRAGAHFGSKARSRPSISSSSTRPRTSAWQQLRFLAALGAGQPERPFLRRRPGPTDLPAALLLEGARRRYPGALPDPADQLPDVPPDPHAGRPPVGSRVRRRGRQHGRAARHRFRLQRPEAGHHVFDSREEETEAVGEWLRERIARA